MIDRRTLLCAAACVPAVTLLACSPQTASQLKNDVNLIASGLAAALNGIRRIPGIPPAILNQLNSYVATIQADAAAITSATPATPTVQEIGQMVQAMASAALPFVPAGSVIEATIQAALSLLPVILAAVRVSGAALSAAYQPDQARLILAAAS